MSKLKTTIFAASALGLASVASAQDQAALNGQETQRTMISLHASCDVDLSNQARALDCLRDTAWEVYDFAATTRHRIRESGLPAGMTFPASHIIQYECIANLAELSRTQIEFAGVADVRDRIVQVLQGCDNAMRVAENLSDDVVGDFSTVFNYGTLHALSAHIDWLDSIDAESLDINLD